MRLLISICVIIFVSRQFSGPLGILVMCACAGVIFQEL